MPDGRYKRIFNIAANTSNISSHDAVMLSVGAAGADTNQTTAAAGASASAYVTFYAENAPMGAGGYPLPATAAATGGASMHMTAGLVDTGVNASPRFTILPCQVFSVGGITGGQLFGLK